MQSETTTTAVTSVPKKRGNMLGVSLALILALGAFFSGFQLNTFAQQHEQTAGLFSFFVKTPVTASSTSADMTEFWHVWQLLNEKFATASGTPQLTNEQKVEGAIKGLVGAYGDPYTTYFPPTDAASFGD